MTDSSQKNVSRLPFFFYQPSFTSIVQSALKSGDRKYIFFGYLRNIFRQFDHLSTMVYSISFAEIRNSKFGRPKIAKFLWSLLTLKNFLSAIMILILMIPYFTNTFNRYKFSHTNKNCKIFPMILLINFDLIKSDDKPRVRWNKICEIWRWDYGFDINSGHFLHAGINRIAGVDRGWVKGRLFGRGVRSEKSVHLRRLPSR